MYASFYQERSDISHANEQARYTQCMGRSISKDPTYATRTNKRATHSVYNSYDSTTITWSPLLTRQVPLIRCKCPLDSLLCPLVSCRQYWITLVNTDNPCLKGYIFLLYGDRQLSRMNFFAFFFKFPRRIKSFTDRSQT